MKAIKFILIVCLLLLASQKLPAYSSGQVNVSCRVSDTKLLTDDTLQVTVSVVNNEAETLNGFYFTVYLPGNLVLSTERVQISGQDVSGFLYEQGNGGEVYDNLTAHRWILETPPAFSENNSLQSADSLQIRYKLTSSVPIDFQIDAFSWAAYMTTSRAIFGHNDPENQQTISFIEPTLQIMTTTLTEATVSAFYSEDLQASGGTPPYIWQVVNGSIPPGMQLDSTSGTLSGICFQEGVFNFEVQARDNGYPQETDYQSLTIDVTSTVSIVEENYKAVEFNLYQNYPNPFNPRTIIPFNLERNAFVEIEIYNQLGQRVRQLLSAVLPQGLHEVAWNGHDDKGHLVTSGIYMVQMHSGVFLSQKKIIYLR